MKKYIFILLLFCSILVNSEASAQRSYYFLLRNNTQFFFSELYIASTGTSQWSNNLLANKNIIGDARVDFYSYSAYIDVYIKKRNGGYYLITDLNMRDIYRITINYDYTYTIQWTDGDYDTYDFDDE